MFGNIYILVGNLNHYFATIIISVLTVLIEYRRKQNLIKIAIILIRIALHSKSINSVLLCFR